MKASAIFHDQLILQIKEINRKIKDQELEKNKTEHSDVCIFDPGSFEPETMPEFLQLQELEELNQNVTKLLKYRELEKMSSIKRKSVDISNQIPEGNKDIKEEQGSTIVLSRKAEGRSSLAEIELQEKRILQAQKENEEAERETEYKMALGWQMQEDEGSSTLGRRSESVEQLSRLVKRELEISDHLDRAILSYQEQEGYGVEGKEGYGVEGKEGNEMGEVDGKDELEHRLEMISQQIVEKLLRKIGNTGFLNSNSLETFKKEPLMLTTEALFNPKEEEFTIKEELNHKSEDNLNVGKKTERKKANEEREVERINFQLEKSRYDFKQMQSAVHKERQQCLSLMEKLEVEKADKLELELQLDKLQDEIRELETELIRHRDEIEELTALYHSEKEQNRTLEEVLGFEKQNLIKLNASLDKERQRSREVSIRDTDTILELRTALEVEKEKGSRLTLYSPQLGIKSLYGSSRHSLPGFRSPGGLPEISVDNLLLDTEKEDILSDLEDERERCDKLKECLEIERERYSQLEQSTQIELNEIMKQVSESQETALQFKKKYEDTELYNTELVQQIETSQETIQNLSQELENMELKLQRKQSGEVNGNQKYDAFYMEDLEAKVEAHRVREMELEEQISLLQKGDRSARSSPSYQLIKTGSFAMAAKHLPADPQEQAVYFYRLLLRAESYRKGLVWQKRYLSLLLSSYQESEMVALERLARMSGARRTLIADTQHSRHTRPSFKVVVMTVIAVQRMKFLVKRWRRTRRSPTMAPNSIQNESWVLKSKVPVRQETINRSPELDFSKKK